jgi:ferrous-iron efflux pump FieF
MAQESTDRPLLLTIGLSSLLGVGKLVGALLTGSQAVLASAADSIGDVVVSAANLWLMRRAREPADEGHPYGHGKIEGLASLAQSLFLCIVIAAIGVRALRSLLVGVPGDVLALPAVAVMVVSLVGSTVIARILDAAAARTGSLVLRADATHYRMDRWTAGATIVGLFATWALDEPRVDAIAALVVCGIMARDVAHLVRDSIDELMDVVLTPEEMTRIRGVLDVKRPLLVGWHDLKTRRSGPRRFVEVHLELDGAATLHAAHEIAEAVENELRATVDGAEVIVHLDPA